MAFTGPYPTVFGGNTPAMLISATTFAGGVTNVGTIGSGGISVISSTLLSGGVVDTGVISGGIKVDARSRIVGSGGAAIDVHDITMFAGGISNGGALAAGISLDGIRVASFAEIMPLLTTPPRKEATPPM